MLGERLGWDFTDPGLLERALTHRSWCAEHPGTESNERLEFLGDAVLGMVITDELMRRHPERSEGWLSRARSDLVRAGTLYAVARDLSLGEHVLLGKGEELTGGREKPSILADAVEALIGAAYRDGGFAAARAMIETQFGPRLDAQATEADQGDLPAPADFKSRLQERCARGGGAIPTYTFAESGPEHDKTFSAEVLLEGARLAVGVGRSKKQAEQDAAQHALAVLDGRAADLRRRPESETPDPASNPSPHEVSSG